MEFFIGACAKIDQVGMVRQAEDVGVTHFGVGEGPLLFSDPYQFLALAARETSTINLGTWVTNPQTRIPAVTANSHATLNSLAPGRTFMGIGTANNALRSMGHNPSTIAQLDDALRVATGLLNGERVTEKWRGKERELEFLDKGGTWYNLDDHIPVWMAAGGPRGIEVAARYADYVAYCLGPDPEMIKLVRRELDKAVADAGRPPGSVKLVAVSWFYQLRNGETWEDGVDHGFASGPISSCLTNIGFMHAHAGELDPSIIEASAAAATAYLGDPNAAEQPHYLDTWSKYQKGLDDSHRPLITKQLCDYWCLYGSPDEIWEKTQGMVEAGVDMVSVFLSNPFTAERDIADIGSSILSRA